MSAAQTPLALYRAHRYWHSCELRRVRAMLRVGNTTATIAGRERAVILRAFLKTRATLK